MLLTFYALVLQCLEHRYQKARFYTQAGSTLIAVNPFQEHPYLYDYETIRRYNYSKKRGTAFNPRHTQENGGENREPLSPLSAHQLRALSQNCRRSPSPQKCPPPSARDDDLPPHVYSIAEAAYGKILQQCHGDQSIIVSGESGAGKVKKTYSIFSNFKPLYLTMHFELLFSDFRQ